MESIASCETKAFPSRLQTSYWALSLHFYDLNFEVSQSFTTSLNWTKIGKDTVAVLWQGNSAALRITCWGMTIRMACTCAKLPECGLSVHQSSAMSQNNQVPVEAFSLVWSIGAWSCFISWCGSPLNVFHWTQTNFTWRLSSPIFLLSWFTSSLLNLLCVCVFFLTHCSLNDLTNPKERCWILFTAKNKIPT